MYCLALDLPLDTPLLHMRERSAIRAAEVHSPSADVRPTEPCSSSFPRKKAAAEHSASAPLIVHVIYRLDIGGMENGLVNLINHMPSDRYRHAIVCLTEATNFRQRLRNADIPVITLDKRPGKDLRTYPKLWRVLRRLRPAIVHTRNLGTIDALLPAALAGVRRRVHGEHGWDMVDLHGASRKYAWLRWCCRPLIHRYITVSRHLACWLKKSVGVPERKLTQIYNGVDTDRFRPAVQRTTVLPQGFASPGCVVIGGVGRMSAVKDPLNLVRAFLHLLHSASDLAPRLRLVMAGDGPLRADALQLLDKAGASAVTWFPGACDDVPELLRALDIFVLPSLNEGISNTILEAMATGLPVIATRVGGNPELVDEHSGALVPPSDPQALARALRSYIDNPTLRHTHGEVGRRRVEETFSLQAMVSSYLKLYDDVLGTERAFMPSIQ